MKRIWLITLLCILIYVPCYGAAIYDATGLWRVEANWVVTDSDGNFVGSGPTTSNWYISQASEEPNDTFFISSFFYGHVNDAQYIVEGPTGLGFDPGDTRPVALAPALLGDPLLWYEVYYDDFQFTLTSNDTGTGHILAEDSGWVTDVNPWENPGPDDFFYVDQIVGHYAESFPTMTRVVPVPGAVWLLGSGLIGIAGISRKFKKT